jgi:putative DNA primase/helicase
LNDVFGGDQDTIDCIQRALGYTLTGSNGEEVMFICYGLGSNGKSVFGNVVRIIIGGYGRTAPASLLTVRREGDGGVRNDLAMLAGSRYVGINELQGGDRLDEQIIKQLVGREPISARFLHREFFEFTPQFTPWLRTNHRPVVTGDDDGIWRRLILIPFRQQFDEHKRDPELEQKLLAERDGILRWMVEGAVSWRRHGLRLSETIRRESNAYRQESDLLGEFLTETCTVDPNARVDQGHLYGAFGIWCEQNGVRRASKASFTRKLSERGYVEARSNGRRFYAGIKLSNGL